MLGKLTKLLVVLLLAVLLGTCAVMAQDATEEGEERDTTSNGVPVIRVTAQPAAGAEANEEDNCDLHENGELVQGQVDPELSEIAQDSDALVAILFYGEGDGFRFTGQSIADVIWDAVANEFGGAENHAEWSEYIVLVAPRYTDVNEDDRVSETDKIETDEAAISVGFESVYFTGWALELQASTAFWDGDFHNLLMGEAPDRDQWDDETVGYVGTAATLLFFKNRDSEGNTVDADYLTILFSDWASERENWCEIDGE